jgi:hypothetical protein
MQFDISKIELGVETTKKGGQCPPLKIMINLI